jgi:hypothetical protein
MRDQDTPKDVPKPKTPAAQQDELDQTDDVYEEEEKLLAGNQDVNMPALLTRDVQGG